MLDRRKFTFGMLLGIGASAATARAGSEPAAAQGQRFGARYAVAQSGKALEVTLYLTNLSTEPIALVERRGSRPGPRISAARVGAPEGEQLPEIFDVDRKELMSRVGPRPTYTTLAAGAEISFGPYRFETPEGPPERVTLGGLVEIAPYDTVELPTQIVDVAPKKAGV